MGATELIIIAVVILILFGSQRLQELARGLGQTTKELKQVKKEFTDTVSDTKKEIEKTITD